MPDSVMRQDIDADNMDMPKRRSLFREQIGRFFRNKAAIIGFIILAALIIMCLLAPLFAPYDYNEQNVEAKFQRPNAQHILGTDNLGRDIFSRLLYGGRISLWVGFAATGISTVLGVSIGLIAGYYAGKVDSVIMRILDVFISIPPILLAITIAAVLGTGINSAIFAVGIASTPFIARLTRAPVLQIKNEEYIEASIAIDATDFRIMFMHLLPNVLSPIIVQITIGIGTAILAAAGLSFLGLGVQPPYPEWGAMISASRTAIIDYPHLVTSPGLAIMLIVIALNLFGDGLRDLLDPRLRV